MQFRALSGDANAACQLGQAYEAVKDYPNAHVWLNRSASANNGCGLNNLGNLYFLGEGVPKDLSRALLLWRKSAALGYPGGKYNLAQRYEDGEGVTRDPARALLLLQSAAQSDYPLAGSELGLYYMDRKAPGNFETAERYLLQAYHHGAAQARYADGQYIFGYVNDYGIGSPRDLTAARRWYKAAADQGQAAAMVRWAEATLSSPPQTQPQLMQALAYLQKSAELGNTGGQANLASLLDRGIRMHSADNRQSFYAIRPDPPRAYVWYSLALSRMNITYGFREYAKIRIAAVRRSLTATQFAQAQREIAAQQQKKATQAAR